jgi:hypothetical protein
MELDPIYIQKNREQRLPKVVVVTKTSDRLGRAFAYGDQDAKNFGGIAGEAQTLYRDGSTPLDGKAGDILLVTLTDEEKLSDIPQEDLEDAHVTAVTTIPTARYSKIKPGHRVLNPQEVAQMNGNLGWVDQDVDGLVGLNDNIGSVSKNVLYGTILAEARREAQQAFTPAWFRRRRVNTRPREVDGQTIRNLDFFITPDADELKRANEMIERCKQEGSRPTIFVPTCPPDAYTLGYERHPRTGEKVYTNTIKYTREPLTGGVSWAAQNALDAVEQLVPHLESKGVTPHIIFGLGDYEYHAGYTRGMNKEGFMAKTNESAQKVADRMQALYENGNQTIERQMVENPDGVHTTHLMRDGVPLVTITGMVELAGGLQNWDKRVQKAASVVTQARQTTEFQGLIERVMLNRKTMTEYWLAQKKLPFTDETRAAEFAVDAGFYIAFHAMVQELMGPNLIVTAGDSRPMELLGSKLTNNLLFSVSGMYDGASFDK